MGAPVTSIAGIGVIKRAAKRQSFSHLEVRIGPTDVTGHTLAMGKITENEPCFQLGDGNGIEGGVFFCKRLMDGRYVTMQAMKDTGIALDELSVFVRSST